MKNLIKNLLFLSGPAAILYLFVFNSLYAQDTTAYRIRMPTANYSAILIRTMTTDTITGTYINKYNAHEFKLIQSGLYKLHGDPAGGTSYVEDTDWGGTNGKHLVAPDDDYGFNPFVVTSYGAVVNDGIKDIAGIQAAADSVNSNGGGVLMFPAGQYEFYGDSVRIYSNTTVWAYGAIFNDTTGGTFFLVNGDSNITFLGGEWNGNSDIDGGYSEYHHGIAVYDAFRIKVKDAYMHDLAGDGVYFSDSDDIEVTNCTIIGNHLQDSPYIGRNCVAVVEGEVFLIDDNIFKGGYPAGVDLEPNASLLVRNGIVSNNTFVECNFGVSLFAEANVAAAVDSIIVENNLILRSNSYGILIQGGQRCSIFENKIKSSGRQGIFVLAGSNYNQISDNDIYNSGINSALGAGIELQDSLRSVSITNNRSAYNRKDGIKIVGSSGNENKNIVVTDNICWDNDRLDSSNETGIRIWYTDSSFVEGNFCYDQQASATQLYGFSIDNCDNLYFGTGNWGFGNKTRLFNFSNMTKERLGAIVAYSWSVDSVDAGTGNTYMSMAGGLMGNFVVPFDCELIALSVAASDTVDADTISVNIQTNETVANFSDILDGDGGDCRFAYRTLLTDSNANLKLSAGDRIRVIYSSTAGLDPDGTLHLIATILVRF